MKISYNPITASALSEAPNNNDITFDLRGLNIFVKGVKFKGTDTTYSVFKKHTSSSGGGYNGLVPVPSYTSTNIRFLREDGTWQVPSSQYTYRQLTNQDLDTLKTEGRWYYLAGGNGVTNGPTNINNGGELYVGRNAAGYRYQKVILTDGLIWFRIWNSSSWSDWKRWYTDANTDSKVLQSNTTTTNYRPLILGYNNSTSVSSLSNSVTQQVYTTTNLYVQPSSGSLWANKLYSGGKEVITSHQSLSNYVTLNTSQTITGVKTFSTQQKFTVASGTSPFTVTSNTLVTNLNADLLDGKHNGDLTAKYLNIISSISSFDTSLKLGIYTYANTAVDRPNDYGILFNLANVNSPVGGTNGHWLFQLAFGTDKRLYIRDRINTGSWTSWSRIAYITDNVASATKLQTARQINGTDFDGTADITTAKWGTARNLTIGNSTKSVNGSGNVSWTLSEIGAASSNHTHGQYFQLQTISGTTDVNTLKDTRLYYTTSDAASQDLVNSPFTSTFSMIQTTNYNNDTDVRRARIALDGYGNMKVFNDRNTSGDGGVWYTVLTSGNYTTIADGRYVTALGTNGNYLTWTKNGTTNNITVPYATSSSKWATARTITLGSYLSGSVSLDGSKNVTLNANVLGLTTQGRKTAISGTTVPSAGVRLYEVYNNGYPTTYGNLLSIRGGGSAELLLAWKNTQRIYVRSKSNVSTEEWTAWKTVAFIDDNVASATTVKVSQHTTNNVNYPIVWSNEPNTSSNNSDLYKSWQHLYYNPSTQRLTATGGFIKGGSSDSYILLGGGGHKALSTLQSEYDSRYVNITGDTMTGTLTTRGRVYAQLSNRTDEVGLFHSSTSNKGGLVLKDTSGTEHVLYLSTSNLEWKGRKVWDNGNDGSGSGLDADLLDGKHASSFMLKTEELTNNVTTLSKSLNVSSSWMDTGIAGDDLATGTYIIQLYINDSSSFYNTYHSGIMSWYKDNTNDSETDEIILHRAGHAYHKALYLRTIQTTNGNGGMKLQIAASSSIGSTETYTFKFKRVI